MSAGTISIQNNAAAVAGDGTVFTTELSAGDFIVITTGGVTYTLPVKSIESDTALTLARNYNGPAVTGAAWTAMPRDTLNRISAQIAADTAYIIRQRVLEVDNWYQLLEVNGNVTIKTADGSSYTGPSWLKLIDVMKEMQIDALIPLAEQIHADAQQVAEDKPVIVQAKDDAIAAASAAATSEGNAATSESNAATSASTASEKADEAAESAKQAGASNPLLALQKSLNLRDLEDRSESWMNVRPVGATPLAADAAADGDAPRWKQVKDFIAAVRSVLASWSVINADTTQPGANVTTYGGKVRSQYNIGTTEKHSAELLSVWNTNTAISGGIIRLTYNGTTVKDFTFDTSGNLTIPLDIGCNSVISKGVGYNGGLFRFAAYASADSNSVNQAYYVENAGSRTVCYQVTIPGVSYQHVWRLDHDGQNKYFSIRSDNNMYTPIGAVAIQGCDVRIKYGFEPPKAGAWERIEAIGICEFMYNGSTVPQRGPLAQQMGDIDPMYVFEGGTATDENGKEFEILNVNEKAVMADMITVIQALQQKVTALEALVGNKVASE